MKNISNATGKLEIIKRLPNSVNGNPRYIVSVGGITCKTKVDSMLSYAIENYDGCLVDATIGTHYSSLTLNTVKLAEV